MSINAHTDAAPAVAVVRARGEIASLDGRLWAAVPDGDLVEVVEQIAGLESQLAALRAEVLVEIDQRGVPRTGLRWASTTDWLAHCAGITRARAKRMIVEAHDLLGDRAETHAALRAGVVSPDQAWVICRGIADLPGERMLRRRAEVELLDQATRLDATDLSRAARRILDVVDPDHEDRRTEAELGREERAAHAQRFFSISDDGAGGVRVKGRGSLEDGAVLRSALLAMSAPEPTPEPEPGAAGDPGASEPGAGAGAGGGGRDVRDHGARTWDALIALAQHSLDTDVAPQDHGAKARVAVTIPVADLLTGLEAMGGRTARTDDGIFLHPAVVRRMACDAEIIPVVLGTEGEVLDVGRAYRTATPAIWKGLVVRDRHCAFPSCSRPPVMCHAHAHHIIHWAEGGETCLGNLVLLCGHHHRTIHDTPWQVRINPTDQLPEFLPPPGHRATTDTATGIDQGDSGWIRHRPRRQ